jgi:NAD(P)-dependent dehydrogenase (short-subunit alcohol dehydrogenase family)
MTDAAKPRVAAITGAGSGLGRAMARLLAQAGHDVAAMDIDLAGARETASSIEASGRRSVAIEVDVADLAAVEAAASSTEESLGPPSLLCANVGVQQFGALEALTPQDWQWVLSVNVVGCVNTVKAFLPSLRRSPNPRHIVLTASSSVFAAGPRMGAYVASKHAVVGVGETLRLELGPEGIGVSLLFPAGMSTRHLQSSVAARPPELGPSVVRDDDVAAMLSGRQVSETEIVTPEFAIRNLLGDLDRGERYIFTHGEYRPQIASVYGELLAAFDRQVGQSTHPGKER